MFILIYYRAEAALGADIRRFDREKYCVIESVSRNKVNKTAECLCAFLSTALRAHVHQYDSPLGNNQLNLQ